MNGEGAPGQAQDDGRAVPVLDVGGLRLQNQATIVRVDHHLTLAALDLLAGIYPLGPPLSPCGPPKGVREVGGIALVPALSGFHQRH